MILSIFSCVHLPSVCRLWWNFSSCLLAILDYLCLFVCVLSFDSSLYILVFVRHVVCRYFLPVCWLSFYFLNRVFREAKFLILMKSSVSDITFTDHVCFWFPSTGVYYSVAYWLPDIWDWIKFSLTTHVQKSVHLWK